MKKLTLLVAIFALSFTLGACQPRVEEEPLECEEGYHEEDGECVEDTVECEVGYHEEAGTCVYDGNVRLGVIGPLTGDYALYGESVRNGAALAVKELNENGGVLGRTVELFAEDSQGASDIGVNAYNKLVTQDEIHALIGGTFSGVTLAVKPLAVQDGIPVFSPTATNPDVTLDAANVFRACYTDSYQGEVAAVFSNADLGATKAAILYNQADPYSTGLKEAFEAKFAELGTVVSVEAYNSGDSDYSAQLTAIAASGAEVVFVPGYVAEVGAILTQVAEVAALDGIPFVGGDGWDSIEADYADVADGHYFANHYAKSDEAAVVQDFVAAYEAEYGSSPNALAALAYDAVKAMAAAMEEAGTTNSADVVAALQAIDFTEAVTGAIKFDENGDPIKAISMIRLDNGAHVLESKVSAE